MIKNRLKKIKLIHNLYNRFRIWSIVNSNHNSNYLISQLERTIPNIDDQYNSVNINSNYIRIKIRYLHAFQIKMVFNYLNINKVKRIIDIGDSSGNHILYLKKLLNKKIEYVSINNDYNAIIKIRNKGLIAHHDDAELFVMDYFHVELKNDSIIICFETLEHLENPIRFLKGLKQSNVRSIIITVPYLKKSRINLNYEQGNTPEDIHIFELSPKDWRKIFKYAGWNIVYEDIYLQYPKRYKWILKYYWRRFDFEGFYGVCLNK